jgi:hypothetical protein
MDPQTTTPAAPAAPDEGIPAHTWFALKFRRQANSIAARYGAPVYLVGGALTDAQPRDFDIRVVLEDDEMARFYGIPGVTDVRVRSAITSAANDSEAWEHRRAYDNLKQSRQLSNRYRRNIDFQVQALHEADPYREAPRLRLDSTPDWVFDADRRGGVPQTPPGT